jgi:hypothetical protein
MSCRTATLWINVMLLAAVISTNGCSQSDRAKVHGTLAHKDGSPVVGARVVARSSETGVTGYGTTDANGDFEIVGGLADGNYDVSILEDRGDPDNRRPATIAGKYREPSTSGIQIEVKNRGAVELNLTLDPP